MRIVIIESPYAGATQEEIDIHVAYARACLFDSVMRGEAPFASHLLYPQILNDGDPEHRRLGIQAGLEIARRADLTAVYMDHGVSRGMKEGVKHARLHNRPIEERWLARWNPVG